jgi:hypothetical protein
VFDNYPNMMRLVPIKNANSSNSTAPTETTDYPPPYGEGEAVAPDFVAAAETSSKKHHWSRGSNGGDGNDDDYITSPNDGGGGGGGGHGDGDDQMLAEIDSDSDSDIADGDEEGFSKRGFFQRVGTGVRRSSCRHSSLVCRTCRCSTVCVIANALCSCSSACSAVLAVFDLLAAL